MDMKQILIVGGGIVGSVLSIFLARRGHKVIVYEKLRDPRESRKFSGRSINLTLCERGFAALDSIGIGEAIRDITVPAYGRVIHAVDGSLTYQPYGNNNEAIYSTSRGELNRALSNIARKDFGIEFNFNQKCIGLELSGPVVTFQDVQSGAVSNRSADIVFGADGAYSAVRLQLQKRDRFNYSQEYWHQGYKELLIPPDASGEWVFEKNALHIWPRSGYMLIGFPNNDGSFTCALHIPFEGDRSFESIRTETDLLRLFEDLFPDVTPYLPTLVEDYFANPANSMVTIRCSPWSFNGKIALIGDSAHAILPSYGQGANAGFEDCALLDSCLDCYHDDWTGAFLEYEKLRKPHTDALSRLCVEHFTEISDLVGDPDFLLRKQIERKVSQIFPDKYSLLYSMITFTTMPYGEAIERERQQQEIIDQIMRVEGIRDKLESREFKNQLFGLMEGR